jgi:hypothetical protein
MPKPSKKVWVTLPTQVRFSVIQDGVQDGRHFLTMIYIYHIRSVYISICYILNYESPIVYLDAGPIKLEINICSMI